MKAFGYVVAFIGLFLGITVLGHALGWFGEAAQVVHEEASPRAILDKYDHFKDMAAQLDAMQSNIEGSQNQLKQTKTDMGPDMTSWPRDARENYYQQQNELRTQKQAFNNLAAEYNADMVKINYAFCNRGSLPQGRDQVLPREYRNYIVN